ncbi:hypothetical protein FOXG_06315 [Fusarium oxysporum f. sp. lycopersici 4287]|uniref:Uncharacterized protein n=1 Tax=Fusarium oxysporum f. sp. lycopersici (strain 4287 / CBS 123668 / FGSC 9935 / NRRL 34936) TaxID=426428 RepID=A0A0J9WLM7_FUSO4|nr:hypothetical protein FOXG_06315 [Fusarium oxysporum f. sp. lycopersici 4287]KNB04052.1 hypothetical protein FOXG_06315 [Fusarium oxysporum f. sp. lycopersici 4287]
MQTTSATYRRKPIMTDDFYNSWVEPSKYPRIPNVYEPIQDTQVSGQCGIREKKESAWADQDSRDSHQSSWATNRKPFSGEEPTSVAPQRQNELFCGCATREQLQEREPYPRR